MKKMYAVGLCGALLVTICGGSMAQASEIAELPSTPTSMDVQNTILDTPVLYDDVVDPSTPVEPTEPTDPSTPVDPTEPTDPSTPVEPTEPTDPSTPTDPTEPSEPSTPTDPTEPTEPSEPTNPTEPSEPNKPTEPSEPNKPTEPTKPTQPSNPTEPTKPVDTTPSPQAPVQTEGGQSVIGVDNGNPIVQNADGSMQTVSPESIGATKQADGTLVVKDATGSMKVLPKMGETERALLSVAGGVLTVISSYFLAKRKNKLV